MATRKQNHNAMVRARAQSALEDLYHNATVTYPNDLRGRTDDYFQSWFNDAAEQEIDYLQHGGAYGSDYRATLAAPCNAGKYKSERAQQYYIAKGMRAMHAEREDCGALTGWRVLELAVRKAQGKSTSAAWHKWFKGYASIPARATTTRNNSRWEYISDYGTLYTYGRGSRTLAPDGLWKENGCGHGCKVDPAELSIPACVDLIRIVESFNRAVNAWCKDVPALWSEHCDYEDSETLAAHRAAAARKGKETRERNAWACRGMVTQ